MPVLKSLKMIQRVQIMQGMHIGLSWFIAKKFIYNLMDQRIFYMWNICLKAHN